LPQVGICLLLQACIVAGGIGLQQWLAAPDVSGRQQQLL